MTFLEEAAKYISQKHSFEGISKVVVVVPSRRAAFYFKQYLSALADTPFLAPDVLAMDDFVRQFSELQTTDEVSLMLTLYDIFKEIDPLLELDRFTTWASVVLRDFEQIDLYLASPKEVFGWVQAEKAIERWGQGMPDTEATQRYFKLFDNLLLAYNKLHDTLAAKGKAYRGMAYRLLAEQSFEKLIELGNITNFYFLGFNALSRSEEKIIRDLVKAHRAEALWDADEYYMNGHHEAGEFLRKYIGDPDLGSGEWNEERRRFPQRSLLDTPKNISVVAVPNLTIQVKVAGAWLRENPPNVPTAVVLGDEALLIPMLFSLPENIEDYNVTMGVSLRNSTLYTFVDTLFELQRNTVEFRKKDGNGTIKVPKFSYKHINKVLTHPFVQRYELALPSGTANPVRNVLYGLQNQQKAFVDDAEIAVLIEKDPLLTLLFTRWNDDSRKAVRMLFRVLDTLRPLYKDTPDALETEYLYEFYTLLVRLETLVTQRPEALPIRSFRKFLNEALRQIKIPFSGEPIAPLQVMGMLETRCLDFERVIVLSVNEGTLPVGKKTNSLIPFDAARELGLPTYRDADAVMSYHFYRLIQRAKEIILVHTTPVGEGLKAEKSRFILQIEHELAYKNRQLKLTFPEVTFQPERESLPPTEIVVQKTEDILLKIKQIITERGISATQLNSFLGCSLQFYLRYVVGINEDDDDPTDGLAVNEFGIWLHQTLENYDRERIAQDKKIIQKSDYQEFITQIPDRLTATFTGLFPGQISTEGRNLVLFEVAKSMLSRFLAYRAALGETIEIIAPEQKLAVVFNHKSLEIKIKGTIDRIEKADGVLRIIDYKTGEVKPKNIDFTERGKNGIEAFFENTDWDILRQLWLYKYLVVKHQAFEIDNFQDVQAAIIALKSKDDLLLPQKNLRFSENENTESFIVHSEEWLGTWIDTLLDVSRPFEKTADTQTCTYCDFKRICNR